MIDLFENEVAHLPEEPIPQEDYMYLGFVDSYDVLLAIEEGEFRIYNYEFWSEDSINDNHSDEDWREPTYRYFRGGLDCLDRATLRYSKLRLDNFDSRDTYLMAAKLLASCKLDLEDRASRIYDIVDGEELPSAEFVAFIQRGLDKISDYDKRKAYYYYK